LSILSLNEIFFAFSVKYEMQNSKKIDLTYKKKNVIRFNISEL